jgi:hypothetical protein
MFVLQIRGGLLTACILTCVCHPRPPRIGIWQLLPGQASLNLHWCVRRASNRVSARASVCPRARCWRVCPSKRLPARPLQACLPEKASARAPAAGVSARQSVCPRARCWRVCPEKVSARAPAGTGLPRCIEEGGEGKAGDGRPCRTSAAPSPPSGPAWRASASPPLSPSSQPSPPPPPLLPRPARRGH